MRIIYFVLLWLMMTSVMADSCPTPKQVKDRKISNAYEWTVKEGVTLDNILAVEKLYSVRIMDNGDYVSCHYTTSQWPVTLDAKPEKSQCRIHHDDNQWEVTQSGQAICKEKDSGKCSFSIECSDK